MGEFWISVPVHGTRDQAEAVLAAVRDVVDQQRKAELPVAEPTLVEDWLSPSAWTEAELKDLETPAINKEIIAPPNEW